MKKSPLMMICKKDKNIDIMRMILLRFYTVFYLTEKVRS